MEASDGSHSRPRVKSMDSVLFPPDVAYHSYRPLAAPVSKLLKDGTKKAHKAAENVHFVREFIHQRVTRAVYKRMVANLYFVYKAMEEALDRSADHPLIKIIYMPKELHRAAELEKDLDYFYSDASDEERRALAPSPVAQAYVRRLRHLGETAPELLVPHAYTRYLGDLSGGHVLKRAAVKGMGLKEKDAQGKVRGTRFYEFAHIANMKKFKEAYRDKLDFLDHFSPSRGALMDSQLADLMVAEANFAFELNTSMFHELDVMSGFTDLSSAKAAITKTTAAAAAVTDAVNGTIDDEDEVGDCDSILEALVPTPPDQEAVLRASLATPAPALAERIARERGQQQEQQQKQQQQSLSSSSSSSSSLLSSSSGTASLSPKDPLDGCPFASLVRATGMARPPGHGHNPTSNHHLAEAAPAASAKVPKGGRDQQTPNKHLQQITAAAGKSDDKVGAGTKELTASASSSKATAKVTCPMRNLSRVDFALLLIVASVLLLLTQPTAAEEVPFF